MSLVCEIVGCGTRIDHLNVKRRFCNVCNKNRNKSRTYEDSKRKNALIKGFKSVSDREEINAAKEKWLLDNHYDLPRQSANGYE